MMDELVFCLYYPLKLTAINFFSMHHFLFLNPFHPCIMLFQYCFHSDEGLKGFPQQRTINISKTTGSCSTPTTQINPSVLLALRTYTDALAQTGIEVQYSTCRQRRGPKLTLCSQQVNAHKQKEVRFIQLTLETANAPSRSTHTHTRPPTHPPTIASVPNICWHIYNFNGTPGCHQDAHSTSWAHSCASTTAALYIFVCACIWR